MPEPTTFERFRKIMVEMYRGYPDYIFYGLFEDEFGSERASRIIQILEDDGLIIYGLTEQGLPAYKLTQRGLEFVFSMMNVSLIQKTTKFNQVLSIFAKVLGYATIGLLIFTFAQIIVDLWF